MSVGVGTADSVGVGVAGAVVGVADGAVVGTLGAGCVAAEVGCTPPAWLGEAAAFGGVLADVEHVGLGDGPGGRDAPVSPRSGAVALAAGDLLAGAVPLLAPPVPVTDLPPLDEEEPMFTIACRTPGTAMAVPANRKTAATASTGLSHAVPNRW